MAGNERNSPGCLAVGASVLVVMSQLPALGIFHYWLFRGGPPGTFSLGSLVGYVAPAFLLAGWLLAIPLLILSPWARRKIIVWIALACGVIGYAMYGSVIGYI